MVIKVLEPSIDVQSTPKTYVARERMYKTEEVKSEIPAAPCACPKKIELHIHLPLSLIHI